MKLSTEETVKMANLNVADRSVAGITRQRSQSSGDTKKVEWTYILPSGKRLEDEKRKKVLDSFAIPPAWENVWLNPDPRGHIQATGVDKKGRTQYRYHPAWTQTRADLKYFGIEDFATTLPTIRQRVLDDLDNSEMNKDKATALAIRIMDLFHIRVGSDEYAKNHGHYGLTTLQQGHVEFPEEGLYRAVFEFTGKSGKRRELHVKDAQLVSLLKQLSNLAGDCSSEELFRYIENDVQKDLKAFHVNDYLKGVAEKDFTAKQFRTWAASWKMCSRLTKVVTATPEQAKLFVETYEEAKARTPEGHPVVFEWNDVTLKGADNLAKLAKNGRLFGNNQIDRKAVLLAVIDTIAADLGNTRAVCRDSYIRPVFMRDWEEDSFIKRWERVNDQVYSKVLLEEENHALAYMQQFGVKRFD